MKKRKRNVGLGIRRKKGRYIKYSDRNAKYNNKKSNDSIIEVDNSNDDLILIPEQSSINDNNVITDVSDHSDDDAPVVTQDVELERKSYCRMKVEAHRWTVFNFFMHRYDGLSPPEDVDLYTYWTGRGGVGPKIKKDLRLPRTFSVKERLLPIFEKILECNRVGEEFHPKMVDGRGGNRKMTIRMDSIEAQIIADSIESGLSRQRTWENVNRHRRENNEELLSESCIAYALRKMRPKMVTIKKRKQGSTDPGSNWAQARYAWTCQLLARFGRLERTPSHGPIERKFDQQLQGKLELDQIVWWDETHRKCLIGSANNPNKNYHILFPRNKEGQFDLEKGEYSKEQKTRLNVKYEKECRLGLGVAMVTPLSDDGTPLPSVGRRCVPYDYTSKVMVSVDDYKKLMKAEFQRVRALKGRSGFWVQSNRDPNILYYQNDPVNKIKGIGKKTAEVLEQVGVKTVGDLSQFESPTEIERLLKSKKISQAKLTKYWTEARQVVDKDAPPDIDHRLSPNPYKSKFGDDCWEENLQKSTTFCHSAYICNYIDHMMKESERVMKGTIHENTWMVYHDALAIMTAKSTKEWMRQKGYLKRWILPSDDLYDNLPDNVRKSYQGKPVGNSPEYMPLDTHLNQDIHASHDYHAIITQHVPEENLLKFSSSTPKRLSDSYIRLTDPNTGVVPSSNRILEDVRRVLVSLERVKEAKGCIIEDSCRNGRRFEANEECNNVNRNWGGKRTKHEQDYYLRHLDKKDACIHNDALLVMNQPDDDTGDISAAHREEDGTALSSSGTTQYQNDIVSTIADTAEK